MNEWKRISRITNGHIVIDGDQARSERNGKILSYRLGTKIEEIEDIENWLSSFDNLDSQLHQFASRTDIGSIRSIGITLSNIELNVTF